MEATGTRLGDLTVRPATLDDAGIVADVWTANGPDEPTDPTILRHRWESAPPDQFVERFIVERDARPAGFGVHSHMPWAKLPKRFAWIGADLFPEFRSPERLGRIFELLEGRSRREGTAIFSAGAREGNDERREFLERRGYHEDRRQRWWELDLAANRERLLGLAEASRERMRREGIRLLTLAEDEDAERYRRAWQCFEESVQDMPATIPIVPQPLEQFMKWAHAPGMREDRLWIARQGDEVLGISVLQYPPVRGNVNTAWTGTRRSVRGKGVARALKLETIAQAIALGVPRIRTGNDATNAPILHLNEELGYHAIPGFIQFVKDA